jgi:single-stranded DNA-specific DHH superfamily exonuclease
MMENDVRIFAEELKKHSYVRIISHHDADGIAAAGILCISIFRSGIRFHASIVPRLEEKIIGSLKGEEAIIFCDIGSAQPEFLSQLPNSKIFIVDHHPPAEHEMEVFQVNPWVHGIDGSFELSASGASYLVARELGKNFDLAGLAIAGALSDKQSMTGYNSEILKEGIQKNAIIERDGIRIGEFGKLKDTLFFSTEPYFDFSGETEKIESFLNDLKVKNRELSLLPENEYKRLASALLLKLIPSSPQEILNSFVGKIYKLPHEVVQDALTFTQMINACGYAGKTGLALSLCLRESSVLPEAYRIYREYQKKLISAIKDAREKISSGKGIRWIYTDERDITGSLASAIIRYVDSKLPVLVLSIAEDSIRVSARGNKELVSMGVDLSVAIRKAAEKVGGKGGGHNVASGASIPVGSDKKFLQEADKIVSEQLAK